MAGLIDPNDIAKARQSGYSDTEISTFLAEKHPEQFKKAREAGYNDQEILAHLGGPSKKADDTPSGVGSGFAQGISDTAGGIASTLGLTGAKAETLKAVEAGMAPKDYKAAPLIREGGHWYNPSDYQPGNLPQIMAQAAPGMAVDMAAGKTGASIGSKVGGARGALIGGAGSVLASIAARTFGKGAHDNAEARTGEANAEVTGADMLREGGKQLLAAPLNAIGGARLAGVAGKAAGVGASGAGKAILNAPLTGIAEAGAGGTSNAINQLGTSVGQEHGKPFDPNQVAEAAAGSGLASTAMVTPRMLSQLHNAGKFRGFDDTQAADAVSNRQKEIAGDRALVGKLGSTKVAAEAVNSAHADIHNELNAASKGVELSTESANTLKRIKDGGKASKGELEALVAEAPEDVSFLARQALVSAKLKGMGTLTDKKFTGGLAGLMEKGVKAVANPVGAATTAGATLLAGATGTLGTLAAPVLGTIAGGYGLARVLDKMTGARSPAKGFNDLFGNPETAVRAPTSPPPEVDPNYDPTTLRQSLTTNAKLEEGMARIAKKLGTEKLKATNAGVRPLLAQLAAQGKLKDNASSPEPTPLSPAATTAAEAPTGPASDAIGALMTNLRAKSAAGVQQAAPAAQAPAAPQASPVAPPAPAPTPEAIAPIMAKISKKPGEDVQQTPHPEADQPYEPTPIDQQWRKGFGADDKAVAEKALADYEPAERVRYSKTLIENRSGNRRDLEEVAAKHEADGAAIEALYHDLDHISQEARAIKSRDHFTNFMSAEAAKAVRNKLTDEVIKKRWNKKKKK